MISFSSAYAFAVQSTLISFVIYSFVKRERQEQNKKKKTLHPNRASVMRRAIYIYGDLSEVENHNSKRNNKKKFIYILNTSNKPLF